MVTPWFLLRYYYDCMKGKSSPSDRRLTENELIFRQINERTREGFVLLNQLAQEHSQPEFKVSDKLLLQFYCECSNLACIERIRITLGEYGQIHRDNGSFIVVPGHEVPKIEKVISKHASYDVVHKYARVLKLAEKPRP